MRLGCNELCLSTSLANVFGPGDPFERIMALEGEIFRDVRGRRTIRFEAHGKSYFAKLHYGVGWGEIFKNLLTVRLPIVSARTEWNAIHRLEELGISTTPAAGYGCRGISPASLRSFVITEDLGDIVSLETLCADWKDKPPAPVFKRRLILEVARIARTLHSSGLNHRDFYLCHFCLDNDRLRQGDIHLYLIDLHRVGIRRRIPVAARMKDIAGLYFSSLDAGLARRDYLRFLRAYRGNLATLRNDRAFWAEVEERARRLYFKMHRSWPAMPFDANAAPDISTCRG